MKRAILALALVAGACLSVPAWSQEMMETVVVTGTRSDDSESIPHVVLTRRADHVITSIVVTCDTRDGVKRSSEMKDTLLGLLREAAKVKGLSLSIEGKVLRDFTEDRISSVIGSDVRADTSRATIVVKTVITPEDTFDSATDRISAFVKRAPVFGRSEIRNDKEWELTVVGPQQYHSAVVAKVAANAKEISAMFGPEYGVHIDGLQHPLQWYRAGLLDLALYVPYSMTVQPR
jgi:hypothetical protein